MGRASKRGGRAVWVLAVVLVLGLAGAALPAAEAQTPWKFAEFSADMQMKGKGRGDSMAGKMYFGGQRWRMDMKMQGQEAVMIVDGAREVMYMIMPAQRMYMEFRTDQKAPGAPETPDFKPVDLNNPCADDPDVTCRKVGSEVVNGRNTDKWEFIHRREKENFTAWVDQKLFLPVRTMHTNGTTMDMTNIQEGPQPASLFQVPAGFQKFDMGGMMKQR